MQGTPGADAAPEQMHMARADKASVFSQGIKKRRHIALRPPCPEAVLHIIQPFGAGIAAHEASRVKASGCTGTEAKATH